MVDHAASITRARIEIITVGIASATARDPLVGALCVRRTERSAEINGTDVAVGTILVAAATVFDLNVRALMSLEITAVDRARIVVLAIAVASAAIRHGVVDTVSVRSAQTLANVIGADLVIITGGIGSAAARDVGSNTLIGIEVAVLAGTGVVIIAITVALAAVGNLGVAALALFVALVKRADVSIVTLGVASAASLDGLSLATVGGDVAVLGRALIMIIAIIVGLTTVEDRDVAALMLETVVSSALIVIIAIDNRVATAFDGLVIAQMSSHVAVVLRAAIIVVAIPLINTTALNLDTLAMTSRIIFRASTRNARDTGPEQTRILLAAVVVTVLIFETASRNVEIDALVLVGAGVKRARTLIIAVLGSLAAAGHCLTFALVAFDITVLGGAGIDVLAVGILFAAVFDLEVVAKTAGANVSRAQLTVITVLIGLTAVGQLDHLALIGRQITVVGRALISISAIRIGRAATTDVLGMTLVGNTGVQRADVGIGTSGIVVAASFDWDVLAHVVVAVIESAHVAINAIAVLMTATLDRHT